VLASSSLHHLLLHDVDIVVRHGQAGFLLVQLALFLRLLGIVVTHVRHILAKKLDVHRLLAVIVLHVDDGLFQFVVVVKDDGMALSFQVHKQRIHGGGAVETNECGV